MNYTNQTTFKINNRETFVAAVKGTGFIVGSFSTDTNSINFSTNPVVQPDAGSARAECRRLAKLNPGKFYVFVRFGGAEYTQPVPANLSL